VARLCLGVGLSLLIAIALLPRALERGESAAVRVATLFGVTGGVVQMIGLLRWVFVVPVLARLFTLPGVNSGFECPQITGLRYPLFIG